MLCPVCRRMVGKDGFCPLGHEVRREPSAKEQAQAEALRPPAPAAAPAVQAEPSRFSTAVNQIEPPAVPPAVSPPGDPPLPSSPPQKPRKAIAIGLALALVAGVTVAWITFGPGGSAGAASLKRVFTAGETKRHALSISIRGTYPLIGLPLDSSFDMEVEERTLSVGDDGSARVRYAMTKVNVIANGRVVDIPDDARFSFTVRMGPDGRVLENDDEGTLEQLADVNPLVGLFGPDALSPLFPSGKVKPGATWTAEDSEGWPLSDEKFTMTLNNTLLEQKTLAGEDVSVIRTDARMPVNLRVKFVDLLAEIEKQTGEKIDLPVPGDVGFTINGFVTGTLTQTVTTTNGNLNGVIGDMSMRGTIGFFGEGAPGDLVFNVDVDVTMTRLPGDAI